MPAASASAPNGETEGDLDELALFEKPVAVSFDVVVGVVAQDAQGVSVEGALAVQMNRAARRVAAVSRDAVVRRDVDQELDLSLHPAEDLMDRVPALDTRQEDHGLVEDAVVGEQRAAPVVLLGVAQERVLGHQRLNRQPVLHGDVRRVHLFTFRA